jgi:periplasmic protein TonB
MFLHYEQPVRRRWNPSVSVSIALHGIVLFLALLHAAPIFVKPSGVRMGERGTSLAPIYISRHGNSDTDQPANLRPSRNPAVQHSTSQLRAPTPDARHPNRERRLVARNDEDAAPKIANDAKQGTSAGSPYGSLSAGPLTGEEIRPALPIVGPQPVVSPSELANGMTGDVIVEITIDEQGNVVRTALLRGLGDGIDEKVLAVLQNWHFRPALRDGSPIASQQDVYFHFGPNGISR